MKYLLALIIVSHAVFATDTKNTAADTIKFNQDNQIDIMVAEDGDSLMYLQSSVMKWLETNKSRVRDYDRAYEVPLIEVKNDGLLFNNQFLRKPGDVSGNDEATAIWHPYTVKVMKVSTLSGDQFKVILTTGEKSPPLPPAFNPSCYIFVSYERDGVVVPSVNWRYLPPLNGVEMMIPNTTCLGQMGPIMFKASTVLNNWSSYGLPSPKPNIPNPQCTRLVSPPPTVSVPGDYEDVAHCILRYASPSPNFCQGELLITHSDGSSTSSNLDRKTANCSPGHIPLFLTEANNYIATQGLVVGPVSCNIVNSHLLRCSASENGAAAYCQGSLHIVTNGGSVIDELLSRMSVNCAPGHIVQFIAESNAYISANAIATSTVACSITDPNNVSCSAGAAGGGTPPPAAADCEIFKYLVNGTLPLTSKWSFTERDCRGMSDVAGLTILEWLETQQHVASVFALNADGTTNYSRLNSNEYCDFHYDASGALGNIFANEMYYNCDVQGSVDNYETIYNTANPSNQISGCTEFTGPLDPVTLKHKATCVNQSAGNISTILGGGPFEGRFSYVDYDPVGELPMRGFSTVAIIGLQGNGGVNNGQVEMREITGGDPHGDIDILHFGNWITLPNGDTIADLIAAGYSYSLSYTKVYDTSGGLPANEYYCDVDVQGNVNNGTILFEGHGVIDIDPVAGYSGGIECGWDVTISEYKNAVATGQSSVIRVEVLVQ